MSERLSLSAQDGALWNRHPSLNFSNISDVTIHEESYMTAIDAGDDTQYLSVISADDDTFEEAQSIALNEQHIEDNSEHTLENTNQTDQAQNEGDQVIIYSVEGSDELYGIQIAQDEEGNLQKYQFQYRATEDGQLEAMPETLTLLPSDDMEQGVTEEPHPMKIEENGVQEGYSDASDDEVLQDVARITVKGEPFDIEPELADIKPDLQRLSIKQELGHETQGEDIVQISCQDIGDTELSALNGPDDQITILEYNGYNPDSETGEEHTIENIIITHEDQSEYTEGNRDELDMYNLDSNHVDDERPEHIQDGEEAEDEQETESETFEAIEGTHITGDDEISLENFHIEMQESIKSTDLESTNMAKDRMNHNKLQLKKHKPMYNCISEKENLNMVSFYVTNQMATQGVKPTHPRSLLKCDVELRVLENEKSPKQETRFGIVPNIKKPSKFGADLPSNADIVDKRFARNKEAMQAMMFDHFINKTTIPHAPVRHNRLPRKQQIKPVANRRDEEIIVQEVMVSSEGFVENSEERLRNTNQFRVTSVVELSDSDDDIVVKDGSKNKSKGGSQESHGVDSDNCVIEINSDDELDKNEDAAVDKDNANKDERGGEKKSRSRSPKSSSFASDDSSPSKKSRTESEPESDSGKKEFDCPHCSKSFPSPNSLNTHIQHHNLENCLRKKELKFPRPEYKYKCDKCQESFKNAVLLNRHDCKGSNMLTCNVCLKKFKCAFSLSVHKKSHVKQNLMKNTSMLTVSPRKSIPRPSMGGVRRSLAPGFSASASSSTNSFAVPRTVSATGRKSVIPKPVIVVTKPSASAGSSVKPKHTKKPETFQCKDCPKVCLSQESLNLHGKSHKKIACNSCNATFTSRLLLDSHVRFSCVKKTQSPKGRLSFKVRKSFVRTPKSTASSSMKKPNANSSSTKKSPKCNLCAMTFSTLSALFEHEVKEHKLHTPDRNMVEPEQPSSSLHKPVHGGVRPNQRFKTAFALFQTVTKSDSKDKDES
ncbi:unnamed protein product [Callosobruchus maculatus]|uniref:C2H2-type domain-containing protein n=1 Tax=Callosobruchus maculatus TaxID=64391 RepID=A0A653DWS9_CALMS|nr:unnamed protein product [Callosobruchus maculatus]